MGDSQSAFPAAAGRTRAEPLAKRREHAIVIVNQRSGADDLTDRRAGGCNLDSFDDRLAAGLVDESLPEAVSRVRLSRMDRRPPVVGSISASKDSFAGPMNQRE